MRISWRFLAIAAFTLAAVAAVVPSSAQAVYYEFPSDAVIDGVVESMSSTTLTITTPGTAPITFAMNETTPVAFGPMEVGDNVRVSASIADGIATVLKVSVGKWYGNSVTVENAVVVSKAPGTLVVQSGLTTVTFSTTSRTRFFTKSFAALQPGDVVDIYGSHTSTKFDAKYVFSK